MIPQCPVCFVIRYPRLADEEGNCPKCHSNLTIRFRLGRD
jgi:uncharacterized paraquat-inducible protein A